MGLLARIVLAVVVAVAVGLACILLGSILGALGLPPAEAVGNFLTAYGWAIGVLAGLWYFFSGRTDWPIRRTPPQA